MIMYKTLTNLQVLSTGYHVCHVEELRSKL